MLMMETMMMMMIIKGDDNNDDDGDKNDDDNDNFADTIAKMDLTKMIATTHTLQLTKTSSASGDH